ncbi:MAG: lipoate--protein ligase [Bacteroidia bacterium]
MIFFNNNLSTSPYFNLALEEYFFKQLKEDSIILWRSKNAIVVGKHQNTLAEINMPYAQSQNIEIARRLSGGGTVYHDLGNLNFTFIQTGEKDKLVDFTRFLNPIIKALADLGVEAIQGKRNELLVDGKKISGNAEHTFKNRVLHHGTLLFNTQLDVLIKSLRINPLKYQDKAIKSVQSRVVNLNKYLDIEFDQFRTSVSESLKNQFAIENDYELNQAQIEEIKNLEKEKYLTWEWNFGYSPTYGLSKSLSINDKEFIIKIFVKKGIISEISLEGAQKSDLVAALKKLEGQLHKPDVVKPFANALGVDVMEFF